MEITRIKIRQTYQETRMRALVSITFDDQIAVHDIKIIEGPERLFVAMPSRSDGNGGFWDIVHPISHEVRAYVERQVLNAYSSFLEEQTQKLQKIDSQDIELVHKL